MTRLDEEAIRDCMGKIAIDKLASLKSFAEIESTSSYLMQQPGPAAGQISVVVTTNQTAGRGRQGKSWQSPPGSGVCLSAAYTFATQPKNLPALTLAIGLAAISALAELSIEGVQLKWPNDLVASGGKLGGILTEVQQQSNDAVTVVAGIGINFDVAETVAAAITSGWATQIVDLGSIGTTLPGYEELAGAMVTQFYRTFTEYESHGFAPFAERWSLHDWLLGREVTLDVGAQQVAGVAAGIADDGALLLDTAAGTRRVTSATIVSVGPRANVA